MLMHIASRPCFCSANLSAAAFLAVCSRVLMRTLLSFATLDANGASVIVLDEMKWDVIGM